MRIGCDLDGCTLDFQHHWAHVYDEWFDHEIAERDLRNWDSLLTATHFTTESEFFEWADQAHIWQTMPAIRGAYGALYELNKSHHISWLTARSGYRAALQTQAWQSQAPVWAPLHHDLGNRKWAIPCDVYIDDSPSVIEELLVHGKSVIIFDQPWNQGCAGNPDACWRAKSWRDVLWIIENKL